MSDVFISYASADRDKARALAEVLESRAVSVFWDRIIPPGKTWDEVLEGALREAKVVVVLWSDTSVRSDWVKAEAADAAGRGILVPAFLEKVELPLRFRSIQAADLSGWDGRATGELESLLDSIARLLKKEVPASVPAKEPSVPPRPHRAAGNLSVIRGIGQHFLAGTGLFYADPTLKRKWLYPAVFVYAALDLALAVGQVEPFRDEFGGWTFGASMLVYFVGFVDTAQVCRKQRQP